MVMPSHVCQGFGLESEYKCAREGIWKMRVGVQCLYLWTGQNEAWIASASVCLCVLCARACGHACNEPCVLFMCSWQGAMSVGITKAPSQDAR